MLLNSLFIKVDATVILSLSSLLTFSPILYKFIVLGSLDLDPHRVGFGLKNSDPTVILHVIKKVENVTMIDII